MQQTSNLLRAANGSAIPVLGEAIVPVTIAGAKYRVRAVISDHIPEPMVGYDFLSEIGAVLDFGKNCLMLDGHSLSLTSKPFTEWIRRVVVQQDIRLPNRHECNVSTKVEFSKLARTIVEDGSLWITEAKELRPGVYLSRTVVPDRHSEVPVRVLNVSGKPVQLRAGSVISELHQADQVMTEEGSNEIQVAPDPELTKVVDDMISRVDPSVTVETKAELGTLMHEFGSIFSKNETDMGLTNIVMHRIDTGDAEPTRQPLRRQPRPAMDAIDQLIPEML